MYGAFQQPWVPLASYPAGVDLGTVMVMPTGANVTYVRSTGPQTYDPPALTGRIYATLAAGLAQCRSGLADTVVCLPGHSESVTDSTMLANLVPGTKILGIGRGSNMPVFRWTATGSKWSIDDADCFIRGLRLRLEGANGVVKAIEITAADCRIEGCDIEVASGASNKATIAIEAGATSTRTEIVGNRFRGTATHNVTDGIKLTGAVEGYRIVGNEMLFSATAANGLIHVTAASLNSVIANNVMHNSHTSSTACVAYDDVACTGVLAFNCMGTINDGTVTAQGATFGTGALIRCFENYSCDEPKKSGVLTPGAAT